MDQVENSSNKTFTLPTGVPIGSLKKSVLSANILISYLEQYEVLSRPQRSQAQFKWMLPLFTEEEVAAVGKPDPAMLYLCMADDAEKYLKMFPTMFFVVITRDHDVPDWVSVNRNRVVLIHSEDRVFFVVASIKNLFSTLMIWESTMDRMVYRHDSITNLLTEASIIVKDFLCITDGGYALMARTSAFEPPDDVHRQLVENGSYSRKDIAHLEKLTDSGASPFGISADDPAYYDGHIVLHSPIYFDGHLFGVLTLVDDTGISEEALRDFLHIITERMTHLLETFWEDKLKVNSPWYRVFTNLIEGTEMTPEFVKAQLEQTEIPHAQLFKLVCINLTIKESPALRTKVIQAARKLNGGKCYCFAYNDSLLVLYYMSAQNDFQFTSRTIGKELEELIYEPYHVNAGASRAFDTIQDLDLAYRQARIALNFSDVVVAEQELADTEPNRACSYFDYILPYYVLVQSALSDRLTSFALKRSVLSVLAKEDRENGTDIVKLLWMYLCNDHSATAIAKRMHIHRNTVLYHIDKIQKTFNIRVDDVLERDRLIEDYRYYFLTDGFTRDIDFKKLLDIPYNDRRNFE
ncbi:MAG: PucR family transcriptional regulator [Coriobacteriales bacterium]|jgi:sugar diacid utilization regulator